MYGDGKYVIYGLAHGNSFSESIMGFYDTLEEASSKPVRWGIKLTRVFYKGDVVFTFGKSKVEPQVELNPFSTSTVRKWALENGFPVSKRGRLPDRVIAAYKQQLIPWV